MSTTNIEKQKNVEARHLYFMPKYTDRAINISVLILAVFGLLMISSASMGIALDSSSTLYLPLTIAKQIIFLVAGYIAMRFLAKKFKVQMLTGDYIVGIIVGTLVLLIIALFFTGSGGSKAWIRFAVAGVEVSIQPSEFAKISTMLIVAAYTGDVKYTFPKNSDIWIRPVLIVCMYLIIILVFQSDAGSAIVIALIAAITILIPSHPQLKGCQKFFGSLLILGFIAVIFFISPYGEDLIQKLPLKEYQINRFLSAINPFIDRYNTGYQLVNGLVSFATGGWFGLGYGNSVRKYTDFPAANTDYILAIVVEELGIVGFLIIFIPYMIIVIRLFQYALKMRSEKGKIILIGTAMYIVIHTLFNIGGVTGLIPLTGVPLLMISSGGSSTMSIMCAIGIAQAVIAEYKKGTIL